MSAIPAQAEFLLHVAELIQRATEMGFVLTGGELWRTPEQQDIYVKTGRSKTTNSRHLVRMAVDFNIFRKDETGKLHLCTRDEIKPLGELWERLHLYNKWGGHFSLFIDSPHFERGA